MISCCLSVKPCKAGLNGFYAVQWNWSCDTLKRCCCVYPPHYVMDCQNKALRPWIMQLDQYVFCSLIDLRRADHGGYTSCVYAPTHTFMPPVLSSTQPFHLPLRLPPFYPLLSPPISPPAALFLLTSLSVTLPLLCVNASVFCPSSQPLKKHGVMEIAWDSHRDELVCVKLVGGFGRWGQ